MYKASFTHLHNSFIFIWMHWSDIVWYDIVRPIYTEIFILGRPSQYLSLLLVVCVVVFTSKMIMTLFATCSWYSRWGFYRPHSQTSKCQLPLWHAMQFFSFICTSVFLTTPKIPLCDPSCTPTQIFQDQTIVTCILEKWQWNWVSLSQSISSRASTPRGHDRGISLFRL